MKSTYALSSTRSAILAAGAAMTVAILGGTQASAQNWEADHQLRAGFFGQFGHTHYTGDNGTAAGSGSGSTGATGFGLTAGAEMLRAGGWTFGLEGDFGQTGASAATIVNTRFSGDYFGSLRGRAGWYARNDWVLYGTGGLGFRGVSITDQFGNKAERTLYGGVYGGGTEWHRGNTIYFAEYLHSQHDKGDLTPSGGITKYAISGSTDAIRLGVKFKLGFDNYTDDVAQGLRK